MRTRIAGGWLFRTLRVLNGVMTHIIKSAYENAYALETILNLKTKEITWKIDKAFFQEYNY